MALHKLESKFEISTKNNKTPIVDLLNIIDAFDNTSFESIVGVSRWEACYGSFAIIDERQNGLSTSLW